MPAFGIVDGAKTADLTAGYGAFRYLPGGIPAADAARHTARSEAHGDRLGIRREVLAPGGVDRDQSDLGDHILTSAVKRVDTSVYDSIKAVEDGTFTGGGDANFGLANEGVALGTISPDVPQSLLDEVDALKQQIIDGTITVPAEL